MGAKALRLCAFMMVLVCVACVQYPPIAKIALLAPFEGENRYIGYNALYASWMALAEADQPSSMLLAIDDGGRQDSALDRAKAIKQDPSVRAVLLVGDDALSEPVRQALDGLPLLVVSAEGELPDEAFTARYLASAEFAPVPSIFAINAYNAMQEALELISAP